MDLFSRYVALGRLERFLGARLRSGYQVRRAAYETGAERWWDLLHPAYALANGQWWVTVNQCGGQGAGAMFGRSRVIAPDGRVVAEAPGLESAAKPQLMTCEVDLDGEIRRADAESFPLWTGGRPEIY